MIDRECKYDEQCHQHTNNTVCVQVSKTIYFPKMSEIQTFLYKTQTLENNVLTKLVYPIF